VGDKKEWDALEKDLCQVQGVQVKTMLFEY